MKPLILMLLFTVSVSAQSLTDVARRERERKAALKPVHTLTTETPKPQSNHTPAPTEKTPETKAEQPEQTPKSAEPAKTASAPTAPAAPAQATAKDEAAKKYAEELAALRAKVVQLQDREIALQLQ